MNCLIKNSRLKQVYVFVNKDDFHNFLWELGTGVGNMFTIE